MDRILDIAVKYDIPVIEDAAEALGSRYQDKPAGSFGRFSILSFNGNKIITTSGGGALLSNEEALITKARFLATQARDPAPHYQHSHIGYNYRMSNIVAGIGRGQMQVLDERVKQRRANFDFYKTALQNMPGISFLEDPGPEFFSNRWLTTVLIDPKESGFTREDLRLAFEKVNIETRPLWKPMHLQPVFSACPMFLTGVSEKLFDKGLCLPSGSNLTDEDRDRILQVISGMYR
jgi:dTDP-4-amino-4,6-dideoxygalactose transaminase